MTEKTVIASGKGDTGKINIATNHQCTARKYYKGSSALIDFDVENPNDRLLFCKTQLNNSTTIN